LAVEELRAALADYYPGVTFQISPWNIETGRVAFRTFLDGRPIRLSRLEGDPFSGNEVLS
jgi:hypothetical protein